LLHPLCLFQFVYQMRKITALKVADKNDEKLKINNGLKNFANSSFKFCSQQRQLVWFHLSLSFSLFLSLPLTHTNTHFISSSSLSLSHTHPQASHTFYLGTPLSLSSLFSIYISLSFYHPDTHIHSLRQKLLSTKCWEFSLTETLEGLRKYFLPRKRKRIRHFKKKLWNEK